MISSDGTDRMTLNLYFLRHGQTALSRANHFCGCGSDPELTVEGQEMAQAFADHYFQVSWQAIYCSTLRRAINTAKPLADKINISSQQRDGLKEIDYGKWEGMSVDEAKASFGGDHAKWNKDPAFNAPTGGETAIQIANRALAVIEEIKQKHKTGNILIVSHKATIRIAISNLLGIELSKFRSRLGCPVASLSLVEFKEDGPLLSFLADRSHLSQRLRDLPGT